MVPKLGSHKISCWDVDDDDNNDDYNDADNNDNDYNDTVYSKSTCMTTMTTTMTTTLTATCTTTTTALTTTMKLKGSKIPRWQNSSKKDFGISKQKNEHVSAFQLLLRLSRKVSKVSELPNYSSECQFWRTNRVASVNWVVGVKNKITKSARKVDLD